LKHYVKNAEKNQGKVKPNEMSADCADGGNLLLVINTRHENGKRYEDCGTDGRTDHSLVVRS